MLSENVCVTGTTTWLQSEPFQRKHHFNQLKKFMRTYVISGIQPKTEDELFSYRITTILIWMLVNIQNHSQKCFFCSKGRRQSEVPTGCSCSVQFNASERGFAHLTHEQTNPHVSIAAAICLTQRINKVLFPPLGKRTGHCWHFCLSAFELVAAVETAAISEKSPSSRVCLGVNLS